MKQSTEEVAEEIVGPNIDGNKYHKAKIKLVAQALTTFAEERVKETEARFLKTMDQHNTSLAMNIERARAEALEEAAKVADTEEELDGPIPTMIMIAAVTDPETSLRASVRATKKSIARRIRALKDKP